MLESCDAYAAIISLQLLYKSFVVDGLGVRLCEKIVKQSVSQQVTSQSIRVSVSVVGAADHSNVIETVRSSEIDVGRDRHFVVLEAFISQVGREYRRCMCLSLLYGSERRLCFGCVTKQNTQLVFNFVLSAS